MFHTKVSVGANEIFIAPPAPPIIFYVSVSFSAYLAILVFHSLNGGVSFIDIASLTLTLFVYNAFLFLALPVMCKNRRDGFLIHASGVTRVNRSGKAAFTLTWREIQDLGFSYKRGLGISQYYSLYFSDSVCTRSKREKVKKPSNGRCAFITFDERSYMLNGGEILAFCKQFTDVKPFTADPRNH